VVEGTSFTCTDFPSRVFTVTEPEFNFSIVPMTCFLSPCAESAMATNRNDSNTVKNRRVIKPPRLTVSRVPFQEFLNDEELMAQISAVLYHSKIHLHLFLLRDPPGFLDYSGTFRCALQR